MLSVYIIFLNQGKAARQQGSKGRFSWILKLNLSFFLRWNEPHHFRASTSIEDDGAISERKKNMLLLREVDLGFSGAWNPEKPWILELSPEESLEN